MHQIRNDSKRAREAVLRPTESSRPVIDHDFGDTISELARQRRQVTVHPWPQPQRLDDLRPEHLQRAPVVMQANSGYESEEIVRDDGRDGAGEERILPVPAPSTNDVVVAG